MKNIHILPTDKPSRLYKLLGRELKYSTKYFEQKGLLCINQNIYITNDEEIKDGDWTFDGENPYKWTEDDVKDCLYNLGSENYKGCKKIILTTDQDLIKDGVQAIDDTFLEWFVKNPSCEEVKIELQMLCDYCGQEHCDNLRCRGYKDSAWYEIIIPKEEPKQEILEEAAKSNYPLEIWTEEQSIIRKLAFVKGAKWQQERMYSEDEVESIWKFALYSAEQHDKFGTKNKSYFIRKDIEEFIEQFKKGIKD